MRKILSGILITGTLMFANVHPVAAQSHSIADCARYNQKGTQYTCMVDGKLMLLGAIGHANIPASGTYKIVSGGKIRDSRGRLYRIRIAP